MVENVRKPLKKKKREKGRKRERMGERDMSKTLEWGEHLHLLKNQFLTHYKRPKPLKLLQLQISPNFTHNSKYAKLLGNVCFSCGKVRCAVNTNRKGKFPAPKNFTITLPTAKKHYLVKDRQSAYFIRP